MHNAMWIWKNELLKVNDYTIFYKEIDIKDDLVDAVISLSAHNHFNLFINDQKVNGYVSPASSAASKTKLSLDYNIKSYLKTGINQIRVDVLYMGGSGQNYENLFPGLIGKITLSYRDDEVIIRTDLTWKYFVDTPYLPNQPFQQDRHITAVEFYDNRVKLNHDELLNVVASNIEQKRPLILPQMIPDGKIHEIIVPTCVQYSEGVTVFDLGRIITGFVEFKLKGYKDQVITIRYSEDLENNFVKHNVANEHSDTYMDQYIMNGDVVERYMPSFTYKSFRYFQIENYPTKVDGKEVKGIVASTGVDVLGHLSSDSYPIINSLFTMFKNTQLNNLQGMLTDCPHREQAQYLGDSFLQSESIAYNVSHSASLLDKVLDDFTNSILEDDTFPFVAPGNYVDPFLIKIPEYDLYFFLLWKRLYDLTGDISYISKYKAVSKKFLDTKLKSVDSNGLIRKNPEWHISDWPYPTVNHDSDHLTVENILTLNALITHDTLTQTNTYSKVIKTLKNAIRTHLMKDGLLSDGSNLLNFHQGINAFGIEMDIFLPEEIESVIKYIKSKGFGSSVILSRSVVKSLFEHGEHEFAFKYLFGFEKGWKQMMDLGYQTFWEGFDNIESHSHAWNGHPVKFIQQYVAGISFDRANRFKVYINPKLPEFMTDIHAKVITEKGLIDLKVHKIDDNYTLEYNIPEGIEAYVGQNLEQALKTGNTYKTTLKIK